MAEEGLTALVAGGMASGETCGTGGDELGPAGMEGTGAGTGVPCMLGAGSGLAMPGAE